VHQTPSIRKESAEDILGIRLVVHAAFKRPGEADLVDGLRRSGALTFSAVAVIGSRIVGHVAFSPVTIDGRHPALALAPVAVAPELQRQGIGSALIRWSLEECRRLGHRVVIVLGEPAYYHRLGFTSASDFGIECPFPVPPGAFMVLELSPGAAHDCRGTVCYRPEFELV
jgi:putative acetyltransferase